MGDPVNKTEPGWFGTWLSLVKELYREDTLPFDLPPEDSYFTANAFAELMMRFKVYGVSNPMLESDARKLWQRSRVEKFNISQDAKPPAAYYEVEGADEDARTLIAAAAPDRLAVPFRASVVEAIRALETQKIVMLFDFDRHDSHFREFVAPGLVLSNGRTALSYQYFRFVSKYYDNPETESQSGIGKLGFNRQDITFEDLEGVDPSSLFTLRRDLQILILDFLDFRDWIKKQQIGSQKRAFRAFMGALGSALKKRGDARVLLVAQGNPLSYLRKWSLLYPYMSELGIDQPSYPAVMMNPQLMNEAQAALFAGVDISDIELISRGVPLLPKLLRAVSRMNPDGGSRDAALRSLYAEFRTHKILVESSGDVPAGPYETQLAHVAKAYSPLGAFDQYVIRQEGRQWSGEMWPPVPATVTGISGTGEVSGGSAGAGAHRPVRRSRAIRSGNRVRYFVQGARNMISRPVVATIAARAPIRVR